MGPGSLNNIFYLQFVLQFEIGRRLGVLFSIWNADFGEFQNVLFEKTETHLNTFYLKAFGQPIFQKKNTKTAGFFIFLH